MRRVFILFIISAFFYSCAGLMTNKEEEKRKEEEMRKELTKEIADSLSRIKAAAPPLPGNYTENTGLGVFYINSSKAKGYHSPDTDQPPAYYFKLNEKISLLKRHESWALIGIINTVKKYWVNGSYISLTPVEIKKQKPKRKPIKTKAEDKEEEPFDEDEIENLPLPSY